MYNLKFSGEVATSRKNGTPILALESTIITHGMPFPQNVEMARNVEALTRAHGATPATIAVMDGTIHIGLEDAELDQLAKATNVAKLSRADLADCVARGGNGATTVAATMILAKMADIDVFSTGGIGGVHQGAETTFDVSADLIELARTDVVVVGAGAKAILDLPKTFEFLETHGVPVIAMGTDELPAFYSRASGIPAPLRYDNAREVAASFNMRRTMGLGGGLLVANPIPVEAEIPADEILPIIDAALAQSRAQNVTAKSVTPFLLDAIFTATEGRSLTANIALVEHNVIVGAQIALELNALKRQ